MLKSVEEMGYNYGVENYGKDWMSIWVVANVPHWDPLVPIYRVTQDN